MKDRRGESLGWPIGFVGATLWMFMAAGGAFASGLVLVDHPLGGRESTGLTETIMLSPFPGIRECKTVAAA